MSNIGPLSLMTAVIVGTVTAAGLLIYEHFIRKKQRLRLTQDLSQLNERVSSLQAELEILRTLQKKSTDSTLKLRRRKRLQSNDTVATESDLYISAAGTDIDSDEEFFDLSDVSDNEIQERSNSHLSKILYELDTQLDGDEYLINRAQTTLLDLVVDYPDDCNILWRIGKSYQKLFENTTIPEKKRNYIDKGIEYCTKALKLDETNASTHKWMAILVGSRANIQNGVKEKINDGHLFKTHLDKALEINPNDWSLYHLMGRFKYEVANLSWIERKAAKTFFAEPPQATFDEAIQCLRKAESLAPKMWKENRLLLAKCYIANSDYYQGFDWLNEAKLVPALTSPDKAADVEIDILLNKYRSFKF